MEENNSSESFVSGKKPESAIKITRSILITIVTIICVGIVTAGILSIFGLLKLPTGQKANQTMLPISPTPMHLNPNNLTPTPVIGLSNVKLLETAVKENILSKYTAIIDVNISKQNTDGTLGVVWGGTVDNLSISGEIRIKKYTTSIYDTAIRISADTSSATTPLDSTLAESLTQQYFLNRNTGTFNCLNNVCTAENTLPDKSKIKFKLHATPDIPKRIFILLCKTVPGSTNYNAQDYCLITK